MLVEIYDVRGAKVATPRRGAIADGRSVLEWDGRDDAGRELPGGIYFVRAVGAGEIVSEKVVLLR